MRGSGKGVHERRRAPDTEHLEHWHTEGCREFITAAGNQECGVTGARRSQHFKNRTRQHCQRLDIVTVRTGEFERALLLRGCSRSRFWCGEEQLGRESGYGELSQDLRAVTRERETRKVENEVYPEV